MKRIVLFVFITSTVLSLLAACGPSQQQMDATVTSVAGIVYATETALAPSPTATFTSTPTPTVTPTPTPTATPTATPTPPNTPTPTLLPSVLFFDDFSGPNTGWDEYTNENGGTGFADGGYSIAVNTTDYCFWSVAYRTFSDVVIEVDAQKLAGSENNEYGVICKLKDNENFYYLSIGSDGYYTIGKLSNGEWVDVTNGQSDFDEYAINSGADTNHIKASCQGDQLSLTVNDVPLIEATDSEFTNGDVGLMVCNYGNSGEEVLFDNYLVSRP
jgi:hypothetical protein